MKLRRIGRPAQALDQSTPRDDGFSLVEVVITIVLMVMVIVPVLAATITLIKASSVAGSAAETERVIADAADRVTRADVGCDYSSAMRAAVVSRGWPETAATATYQYYTRGASATAAGSWSVPGPTTTDACPGGQPQPRLIQLVTITITDESGNSQSIQVVKSDV
jgi:type II secretory pathway pseudopilin PulG